MQVLCEEPGTEPDDFWPADVKFSLGKLRAWMMSWIAFVL